MASGIGAVRDANGRLTVVQGQAGAVMRSPARLASEGAAGGGRAGCHREPEPRAGKGGEYVHMQAHGRRRRARIGAPFNEELVGSKAPAGGRRAERAEEPSLLVGLPTPLRSAMQPEQGKGARIVAERPSLSGKLR